MACPTCGHTIQNVHARDPDDRGLFWCPRCGTLWHQGTHYDLEGVPKLVERCRRFEAGVRELSGGSMFDAWQSFGIAESINVPADRK